MHFRRPFFTHYGVSACHRVLAFSLGTALLATTGAAGAFVSNATFAVLESGDFHWTQEFSVSASGVPIHVRAFTSSAEPAQLAEFYSTRSTYFQRILVAEGTVLLSGLRDDQHWLAEVRASSSGSVGRVSVMQVNGLPAAVAQRPQLHSLLPPQSRLLYSQGELDGNTVQPARRFEQHVVKVAMPAADVTAYLRQQLRSNGWAADPMVADGRGAMTWRRRSSQLMAFTEALTPDSAALIVHLSP